jgi:hypothetical protein
MNRDDYDKHEAAAEVAEERSETVAELPASPAGRRAARSSFGGLDLPASFGGMLAGLGFLVILAGLLGAAITGFGYQTGIEGLEEEVTVGGMIAGFFALFVAFLAGGWVAGRMARYDGLLNGVAVVVLTLAVAALFGLLGMWVESEYNFFGEVGLPTWFTESAGTTEAIAGGVAAFAAMLLGALLGGWLGERYHRGPDYALAEAQEAAYRRRGFFARRADSGGMPRAATEREAYCQEVCAC